MTEQEFNALCRRSQTHGNPDARMYCIVSHAGRRYPAEFAEIRDGLLFVKVDRRLAVFPQGEPQVDTLLAPLAEFEAELLAFHLSESPTFEVR